MPTASAGSINLLLIHASSTTNFSGVSTTNGPVIKTNFSAACRVLLPAARRATSSIAAMPIRPIPPTTGLSFPPFPWTPPANPSNNNAPLCHHGRLGSTADARARIVTMVGKSGGNYLAHSWRQQLQLDRPHFQDRGAVSGREFLDSSAGSVTVHSINQIMKNCFARVSQILALPAIVIIALVLARRAKHPLAPG